MHVRFCSIQIHKLKMYSMLIYKYLASASNSGVCMHDVEPSHCLRQGHTGIFNDKQHGMYVGVTGLVLQHQ